MTDRKRTIGAERSRQNVRLGGRERKRERVNESEKGRQKETESDIGSRGGGKEGEEFQSRESERV